MKQIAIIGGGIAGMAAALYLSKAGHSVTVFERDSAPMPASTDEAFNWNRRGAPQMRHSHAMLGRMRKLFNDDHPEVLSRLLEAGATEMKMFEDMPTLNGETCLEEGDKDVVMLACRRATLEWVMRSTLLDAGQIDFRCGAEISGLLVNENTSVRGLSLADGSEHPADIVVAADGRRSQVPRWLDNLGIQLEDDTEDSAGIVYFSRFYKLKPGSRFPTTGLVANDLGYLFYAAFCGDGEHYSIALSANEDDQALHQALKDPELFEAAAGQIPELQSWLASGTATTEVFPMGGLINRRRHFLKDGAPVLPGLHVIGDAHVCTNPAYGRGLSLAVWQAQLLADSIAEHPDDRYQQSLGFCNAVQEHIVPWYDISVMMDGMRRAERERLAREGDTHGAADNPMKSLSEAANADPEVWRGFWRTMNLLESPMTLMEPAFLERVTEVVAGLESGGDGADLATEQQAPDRSGMFEALGLSIA